MAKGNFLMLAAWVLLFLACAKEEEKAPVAVFTFSINKGAAYAWEGPGGGADACILCGPHIFQRPSYFTLSSSAPDNTGRSIILTFATPEVGLTTYTETIGESPDIDPYYALHVLYLDPLRAASTQEGDYATVTFTRVQAGQFYDGTFRARLTAAPYGPEEAKLELEGEFRNVRLHSE